MPKPIKISIPTPCHENWDTMTPEVKGRFCASCQKTVFDFTNASDREIASILKSNTNTCGRFKASQLERELIVQKEKSSLWMATSAAVISFMTIGNNMVSAQTQVNTEQTDSKTDDIIGDTIVVKNPNRILKGIVKDEDDNPIPGARITNVSKNKNTESDFNGNFAIEADKDDSLEIIFLGMQQKTLVVNKQNDSTLHVIKLEYYIMGWPEHNSTFFGRIFNSIGSMFR